MTLMRLASLVLLTSRHEGMPNILMEAQLAGVPVVATRVGGDPDCVTDGITGLLLPESDPDGLAAACERVLNDSDLAARMERRRTLHAQLQYEGAVGDAPH